MDNKDYFFCYTKRVSDFLRTKKMCSLYKITPDLQAALAGDK